MLRSVIRKLIPPGAIRAYRAARRRAQERRFRGQDSSSVFTTVYSERMWGGDEGAPSSGAGTRTEQVTKPYLQLIVAELKAMEPFRPVVVDLGCGDFVVGRQLLPLCDRYIAVDVVDELLERHRAAGYGANVQFSRLDICSDALPDGDICFVRQVLQHLSNAQIESVLPKLSKYKTVFITEHQPSELAGVVPNVDKECGPGIRLYRDSGVFLDAAPFNIPRERVVQVLEVPAGPPSDEDPGMIRTFRIEGAAFRRSTSRT